MRGHWMPVTVPDENAKPVERHTVRRVVDTFRPYKRKVSIVAGLIVVTASLGIVNPLLIRVIFGKALFCPNGCPRLGLLGFLVGLMVLIPIVSGLIGIGQTYLANVVGLNVMKDLRNALYQHLQRMPLRFFTATRTGEIQSRMANDVGRVQPVATATASTLLSNIVIIISTVAAMLL